MSVRRKDDSVALARRADAAAAPADGAHAGPASLGLADERILGEISHEMGNYFHKLYYWTEHLKTHAGERDGGDETAVDMLGSTIERLERFMRMTLEYFAPARLCFNRVAACDLVAGLNGSLAGRGVRVEGLESFADTTVLADASLIGHSIRTIFEGVAATLLDEDEMLVSLAPSSRHEFGGLEIEFRAGEGISPDLSLVRGIEMAVAEKFLQMHGGELFERKSEDKTRGLVVFLPIYS